MVWVASYAERSCCKMGFDYSLAFLLGEAGQRIVPRKKEKVGLHNR